LGVLDLDPYASPAIVGRTIIRTVFPAVSGAKFAPVNAAPSDGPMEMVQAENHLARPPGDRRRRPPGGDRERENGDCAEDAMAGEDRAHVEGLPGALTSGFVRLRGG